MNAVIVTRHAGLVEWLRRHGVDGEVVSQATVSVVAGKDVYGVLPLYLAARAASITTVDMPLLRPDQRGVDLAPDEMDAAGAVMTRYRVTR